MEKAHAKILLVDDDHDNLLATQNLLIHWGLFSRAVSSGKAALHLFMKDPAEFPLVLLDLNMPEISGMEVLAAIKNRAPETTVIIYSCDPIRDQLKAAMKAGADDFILKDESLETLKKVLELATNKIERRISATLSNQEKRIQNLRDITAAGMVGKSDALAEVARLCLRYRENRYPVLILGETGTGKELAAKAIHGLNAKSFFPYNCATTTQTGLLESELFGSLRGAFTGAVADRTGLLEMAREGSVFLDEIHHLSLSAQASLLRTLSQSAIRKVGSSVETPIHCRFIVAGKPELDRLTEEGAFLQDLMFRLDVIRIEIPPLRDRKEDIEVLARHFLGIQGKKSQILEFPPTLSPCAIQLLEKYRWPGNIRELQSWMTTLYLKANGVINSALIQKEFGKKLQGNVLGKDGENLLSPATAFESLEKKYFEERRNLVLSTLQNTRSQRQAAVTLGINESSLRAILKEPNVEVEV